MTILLTGAAGFIGLHVARALLARGEAVLGLDNLNPYYDPALKQARLAQLAGTPGWRFVHVDFADAAALAAATDGERVTRPITRIVHLGAQAGVRYSLENPAAYAQSNLVGHLNLLELARHARVAHMVYASSSSVYGGNTKLPFALSDRVDSPVSLYAATKKSGELLAESYAHLFRTPLTGLRFFTVYGPWGRPDMALWQFADAILAGRPIRLFNHGDMSRDFTFIDDITTGVLAALDRPPADDGSEKPGGSRSPHALYNLGNSRPEPLLTLVATLEDALGVKAIRQLHPMQPGDVHATFADIAEAARDLGFAPTTSLAEGIPRFTSWFRQWRDRSA
ncbi:NAD-dependent epimerase/dehydratase family protein [Sandaracinobacteroides saxicola]|uniref:NAD-dependent epimerase/dehydratase family protein n=1 Tax=Sandaracinobacteroides saxicola TaxID=2759707 RepID=A0A7G5IFN5_9SPHN|nr:NAD-dependent epimerase/dehydratase family protein [Sandaracinobacteroides saxicola]QMW22177.1 NAD-dependent epimerase/dehydratase family protein [Sandaracinobacteroides saxicola]